MCCCVAWYFPLPFKSNFLFYLQKKKRISHFHGKRPTELAGVSLQWLSSQTWDIVYPKYGSDFYLVNIEITEIIVQHESPSGNFKSLTKIIKFFLWHGPCGQDWLQPRLQATFSDSLHFSFPARRTSPNGGRIRCQLVCNTSGRYVETEFLQWKNDPLAFLLTNFGQLILKD